MALTITKEFLGGSANGKSIPVAAVAIASGTVVHTAHATAKDEVWLYATNVTDAAVILTIGFGGKATGDLIYITIPPKSGMYQILPGMPITASNIVYASASVANAINLIGWVNRIA